MFVCDTKHRGTKNTLTVNVHAGDDLRVLYRLDDGTGLVHVTKWVKKDADDMEDAASLGDLVTVRGKIRMYKELSCGGFACEGLCRTHMLMKSIRWLVFPQETGNFCDGCDCGGRPERGSDPLAGSHRLHDN